jgi:aryl-alcohol dehydrogenase-like predicted oxidoreductase
LKGFEELFLSLAYDQGIHYFDCAEAYATFPWIADAIKGLPREKPFLQSKIGRQPTDVLAAIDRHRQTFNTDEIDEAIRRMNSALATPA